MLELRNICKIYNPGTVQEICLFENFNLSVPEGQFVSVVGSNGSGKTSMLNIICGSIAPDSGSIILADKDIVRESEHRRARRMGRVYQNPAMGTCASMPILENMALADNKGKRYDLRPGTDRRRVEAYKELLRPLGLINSKVGLILIYTGTMAEFGLLNMKGYFDTIPREIEEAAEIDGASGIQLVTRIVLPLARPSILVTAVMILIYVWNEYLFETTFMTGAENYTLAAGLYSLQATEMSGSWPVFAAASLVVSLPILIVFFAVQRHMTSGLTAGGVKG